MPVRVFYKNRELDPCTIRPTPLVTIDTNILKTGGGESYGVSYAITLTGTLLADQGTPYAFKKLPDNPRYDFHIPLGMPTVYYCGPYNVFDRTQNSLTISFDRHISRNGVSRKVKIDVYKACHITIYQRLKIFSAIFLPKHGSARRARTLKPNTVFVK